MIRRLGGPHAERDGGADDHCAHRVGLNKRLQRGAGFSRAHAVKAPGDHAVGEEEGVGDLVGK